MEPPTQGHLETAWSFAASSWGSLYMLRAHTALRTHVCPPLSTAAKKAIGQQQEDALQSRKRSPAHRRVPALLWRAVWEINRCICLWKSNLYNHKGVAEHSGMSVVTRRWSYQVTMITSEPTGVINTPAPSPVWMTIE